MRRCEDKPGRLGRHLAIVVLGLFVVAACTPKPEPVVAPPPPPVVDKLERRPIPPSGKHRVEPGETLSEIAYIYRLHANELAHANGITDPNTIIAGNVLALRYPRPQPPAPASDEAMDEVTPLRVVITPIDAAELEAIEPASGDDPNTWDGGLE